MLTHIRAACLASLLALTASGAARAQTTAFTYQGRLKNGAQPAAGLHDFRFALFDAASAGTQVGTTQCADNLAVADGVFTATIDFGQQFATSEPRFLQIEVRADTGLTCGNLAGFVTLAPRQPINPAPAASHANAAFSLDAPDGSPANAVFVDNDGKVGLGTTAPAMPLHIRHEEPVALLHDSGPASTQSGYLGYWNSNNAETAWVGFGTPGSPHFSVVNARAGGGILLLPGSAGNVGVGTNVPANRLSVSGSADVTGSLGVGTTAPAARLDVRGDIRFGPSGQHSALGGQEALRMIRGDIDGNGTITRGTGFTVTRSSEGVYDVTFTPGFSGIPTVSATAVIGTGSPRWATSAEPFLSASTARIVMVTGGAYTDSDWSLIVVGPR